MKNFIVIILALLLPTITIAQNTNPFTPITDAKVNDSIESVLAMHKTIDIEHRTVVKNNKLKKVTTKTIDSIAIDRNNYIADRNGYIVFKKNEINDTLKSYQFIEADTQMYFSDTMVEYNILGTNYFNPTAKYFDIFDSLHRCTSAIIQQSDNPIKRTGKWLNVSKTTMKYNLHGDVICSISYKWDSVGWHPYRKDLTTYDDHYNPIDVETYYSKGKDWFNIPEKGEKMVYSYTSLGQTCLHIFSFNTSDSCDTARKEIVAYCKKTKNDSIIITQYKGFKKNGWTNDGRDIYKYDTNNNIILFVSQNWKGRKWKDHFKIINTYNNYGETIHSIGLYLEGPTYKTEDYYYYALHKINQSQINKGNK